MPEIHRIRLGIRKRDGRFKALLHSNLQRNAVPININATLEDFRGWNESLTTILTDLTCRRVGKIGNRPEIPQDARDFVREEFRQLAERGFVALNCLFDEDDLVLLREMMGRTQRVILDIDSESFGFPWELLYDDYERGHSINYESFWGYKYIIYRNIPLRPGRQAPASEIEIALAAHVGLLADKALRNVAEVEIPFLHRLQDEKRIKLSVPLKHLNAFQRDSLLEEELKRFFGQEMHIVHFACHTREPYRQRKEPSDEYCLLLSKEFPLWPQDFTISKLKFGDAPLVILNACGTSPRDPHRTWNMVRVLFKYGARGVVTTECMVPDALAAAFTKQFYPLFLGGQELGDALFEAKTSLLKAPYHNPLGLLYALYAFPGTRFIITN
jgi:hypothetical protein